MLSQYPKSRPPLSEPFKAIYEAHYKENREGRSAASSIAQRLEAWMHLQVSADVVRVGQGGPTLELGAGTLNHLPYEPSTAPYDVVEPFSSLYSSSRFLHRISRFFSDISEVPLHPQYERIISIAALEHILDLPSVVATAGLLLQDRGQFRVAIPSEGSWLWALGWRLTTGLEFAIRHGLDYATLLRHEHVNTASEIEQTLSYFFGQIEETFLGISKSASFYRCFFCTSADRTKCTKYLTTAA